MASGDCHEITLHFVTEKLNLNGYYLFVARAKLPANAAKPATNAPIKAVISINAKGLSIFKINTDTLCANICSLLLLIYTVKANHKRYNARNPVRKDGNGFCGIRTAITNATIAMLHQGQYKQIAKLSKAVNSIETRNFILPDFFITVINY
jgi:hypothetical protein